MKIQFLGCGDAFGSGGRLNTCFLVDAADTRFLIDCGATSLVGMNRCGVDPNSIDMILLSHLHGDHFGGVMFMLVHAHSAAKRDRPLSAACCHPTTHGPVAFPRGGCWQQPPRVLELAVTSSRR